MSSDAENGRQEVTANIQATVLPSFVDQMDEYGKGDTDMRMPMGKASDPDTGESVAEILTGMSGKVWVEFEDDHRDGQRVAFTLNDIMHAAHAAIDNAEA